jgi:hypothetical protein
VQEQSTEHSPRDQTPSPRVEEASEGSPLPPSPDPSPPFLSTAGRCLSYALKAVTRTVSWTVTAAKQGSTAMAAATFHFLQSGCHRIAQPARQFSVVQTTVKAAAKLQQWRSKATCLVPVVLSLSTCAAAHAQNVPWTLWLRQACSTRLWLCSHCVGLILSLGPYFCHQMWQSLPDGYTLAGVLLKEGPAILGCFLLAADVAQLLGGFIPTAPCPAVGTVKVCLCCVCGLFRL